MDAWKKAWSLQKLTGEATWVITGQVSVLMGSLVLVRLLSEFLTPPEYGLLALALTVSAFGQSVIFGGFRMAIIRFYSRTLKTERFDSYVWASQNTVLRISSGWVFALLVLAIALFSLGQYRLAALLLIVMPYSAILGVFSASLAFNSAARERRLVAIHQGLDSWLKVALILIINRFFDVNVYWIVVAYIGITGALCTSLVRYSIINDRKVPKSPSYDTRTSVRQEMINYSTPIYIWGPFVWAQQVADKWSLATFSSVDVVGYYAVVLQLTYAPMRLFVRMFTQFFAPIFFSKLGTSAKNTEGVAAIQLLIRIGGIGLLVVFVAFFLGLLLHNQLFEILVAEEYRTASQYFPWLLLSAGLVAVGQIVSLRILGERKTGLLLAPKVVSALIGTFLIVAGAFIYGIWGVIGAELIFGVLHLAWITRLSRRLKLDHDVE